MEGESIQVKCAPKEWPLFSAPGLSSMRLVGYKEKGGMLVSESSSSTASKLAPNRSAGVCRPVGWLCDAQCGASLNSCMLSTYNHLFSVLYSNGSVRRLQVESRSDI